VALEQYKTQILLLHSEQSTLEKLSTGFDDQYSVHMATTGIEALNVFTETPVHVIVSAQDLPGMSGLDALREAKKRSPSTIGILLADGDKANEALVSDKEVFQIVYGDVTPEGLREVIDAATQKARILAMSESANDSLADVDHPTTEHIVMETSENGSTIISSATGQMPALQPSKISVVPDSGSRNVDILVLTKDDEFLATIKDSSRGLHNVHHAVTPTQAEDIVKGHKVGVLVTDAAMVGSNIEVLTLRLRQSVPRLVAVVAGRRDDGELLMDLINRGHVYRFLLKPVSPGRARLAIEASIKHHLEADDKAFKKAPQKAQAAAPKPAAQAAPQRKATPETVTPAPINVSREDSLLDEGLDDAFDDGNSFTETMTGIAVSFGKKLSDVAETMTSRSKSDPVKVKMEPAVADPEPVQAEAKSKPATVPAMEVLSDTSGLLMQNRKILGIAAAVVIAVVIGWFSFGSDDTPTGDIPAPSTVVESDILPTRPAVAVVETVAANDLLASAREARDAGQLISPPGDNAIELFVAALQAVPDNSLATVELDAVVEQVFAVAETAILTQDLDEASTALQLLYFASPDNPRLPFLSAQLTQLQLRGTLDNARIAIAENRYEDASTLIANAKILAGPDSPEVNAVASELQAALADQQVGQILEKANEKLAQNQLITPANENARYYYQLALSSDPDNVAAGQGLVVVASKLVAQAGIAIGISQFTNAEDLLRNARALDPTSTELAASTAALADAKAAKVTAESDALAEANRIAEQERVAEQERIAEQQRIAEQERIAEQQRIAENQRIADEERRATAAAAAAVVAASNANADTGSSIVDSTSAGSAPASSKTETESGGNDLAAGASAAVALNSSPSAVDTNNAAPAQDNTAAASSSPEVVQSSGPELVRVSSLTRINYVAPKYPRSARRRNITGSVDISFVVQRSGIVSDVLVTYSTPGTVFNQAAMDAVAQWRFEPTIENGQPVEKRTAIRLAFNLK